MLLFEVIAPWSEGPTLSPSSHATASTSAPHTSSAHASPSNRGGASLSTDVSTHAPPSQPPTHTAATQADTRPLSPRTTAAAHTAAPTASTSTSNTSASWRALFGSWGLSSSWAHPRAARPAHVAASIISRACEVQCSTGAAVEKGAAVPGGVTAATGSEGTASERDGGLPALPQSQSAAAVGPLGSGVFGCTHAVSGCSMKSGLCLCMFSSLMQSS